MDRQQMQSGEAVAQVRVTNKNTFAIKDRFDGVDFVFAPNKPVNVPPDVAAHCFGLFPRPGMTDEQAYEDMLKYCAIRHGWNASKMQEDGEDRKRFENIDIVPVRFRLVEDVDNEGRGKKA